MSTEIIIRIIFVLLLAIFFILRSHFTNHHKGFTFRTSIKYVVIGLLLFFYLTNNLSLGFLNISYNIRIILGFSLFIIGSIIFFWAHFHLGKNWSPIIEKRFSKSRTFITSGPYNYIRHPIYSSSFIILISIFFITGNWLFTGLLFLILTAFYLYKVPREEEELIKNFGKKYENYKKNTGGLIPRIKLK